MNLPTGENVHLDFGTLTHCGTKILVREMSINGDFIVIEDLGVKITLQPKAGGANVTVRKVYSENT